MYDWNSDDWDDRPSPQEAEGDYWRQSQDDYNKIGHWISRTGPVDNPLRSYNDQQDNLTGQYNTLG